MKREGRKREKRPDGQEENFYTAAGQMSFADIFGHGYARIKSLGTSLCARNKLLPYQAMQEMIC